MYADLCHAYFRRGAGRVFDATIAEQHYFVYRLCRPDFFMILTVIRGYKENADIMLKQNSYDNLQEYMAQIIVAQLSRQKSKIFIMN